MCRRKVLKLYKIQIKFENHEFCRTAMMSYVEVVVKSWERFEHFDMYVVYKPEHLTRSFKEFELISLGLMH
jgi:hypothetical protein